MMWASPNGESSNIYAKTAKHLFRSRRKAQPHCRFAAQTNGVGFARSEDNMILNIEHITENNRFWYQANALAKEAFPPKEYLAPSKLVEMAKSGNFDFWALSDKDIFVGFMVIQTYKDLAYLFFLAIDSSCRSKGYGSSAIETMKATYPDKKHVVDFEMLDDTSDNNEQRKKRREFYLRNGYKETGLFLSYLGVDYEVFCMDAEFDEEEFKDMMKNIQVEGFAPRYFRK